MGETVVIDARSTHEATMLVLHGFTGAAGDMMWIEEELREGGLDTCTWKFVFPTAPARSITCYGGEVSNAWYDYLTDYCTQEEEIAEADVREQRSRLHRIMDDEVELLGGISRRLFVAGYSQGGCMALDVALTYPTLLGGVICRRCHVMQCSVQDASLHRVSISGKLHICAWHGEDDDAIGLAVAQSSYNKLLGSRGHALGVELELTVEPGLKHVTHS